MREDDVAAALLSAMIAHRPLSRSPAGRTLDRLLREHDLLHEELARRWREAGNPDAPLPSLLHLSGMLARHTTTDLRWADALGEWLRRHAESPQVTHNSVDGSATVHGPTVQARSISGGVHFHQGDGTTPGVPRQLPPVPAHFTGRENELRLLHELIAPRDGEERGPRVVVLWGPGGVGKTALALRWLHEVADRHPDGQLSADLTSTPGGEPLPPDAVLGGLLRGLGVEGDRVPVELREAAALFRSLTAGRRIALLLDNAVSAAQVRAVLPSSAASTVVVTTRWRLGGLAMDGAAFIPVSPLPEPEGKKLLARALGGQRARDEADAVSGLVGLCAGLPLALSIAGARLVAHPEWPVARIVGELKDEQRRLRALAVEEVTVVSVFDLSYDSLSPGAARAYRWLGCHPGPDLSVGDAAAVLESSVEETAGWVEGLVDASLLVAVGPGRYRFHELVRLHARQRAQAEDGTEVERLVVHRLLEHHLSWATVADRVVTPLDRRLYPEPRGQRSRPVFASPEAALEALESELPQLMAVLRAGQVEGFDLLVCRLAEALWSLFLLRKHFHDWLTTYELGVASATRLADDEARSRMHRCLGFAHHNLGRAEEALRQGRMAVAAARRAGHEQREAEGLNLVGMAHRLRGRPEEAIGVLRRALVLEGRGDHPRAEALSRRRLGQAMVEMGRVEEAIEQFTRSRDLAASLDDQRVTAMTMVWLADALTRSGRPRQGVAVAREAWEELATVGSDQDRAQALMVWGEATAALEDWPTARDLLRRSRSHYERVGAKRLGRVNAALERVEARCPEPPPASP
ncbi:NB-ARC domain-containing protein [Streptomyces sp. NPDC005438]|uniref:ATP-binding protein n=1 Tax=Streptomyces sp. NPDC005438 TaxID=3156880 RepID=UPI0033BA0FF9